MLFFLFLPLLSSLQPSSLSAKVPVPHKRKVTARRFSGYLSYLSPWAPGSGKTPLCPSLLCDPRAPRPGWNTSQALSQSLVPESWDIQQVRHPCPVDIKGLEKKSRAIRTEHKVVWSYPPSSCQNSPFLSIPFSIPHSWPPLPSQSCFPFPPYWASNKEHRHSPHNRKVSNEWLKNHPQDAVKLGQEEKIKVFPQKMPLFPPQTSPYPRKLRAKAPYYAGPLITAPPACP